MKKYLTAGFVVSFCFSLSIVSATSVPVSVSTGIVGDVAPDQASEGCTDLSYNLIYKKSKDANTNGEVSDLQYFLQDQGLLNTEPNGIFGPATLKAVKYFQKKSGFITSGYVGPMTRAKIKEISCNDGGSSVSISPSTPVACTMEYRSCADGSPMPRDANCKWREDKCTVKEAVKIHEKACKGVGTRSEGWYDSATGELIKYDKCSPVSEKPKEDFKISVLKIYFDGSDNLYKAVENISKEIAYKECKETYLIKTERKIRCTWNGDEIFLVNQTTEVKSIIKVLSPNGYENFKYGATIPIKWWSSNPGAGSVSIYLKEEDTGKEIIIEEAYSNIGYYEAKINQLATPDIIPDKAYRVLILLDKSTGSALNHDASDLSDMYFKIIKTNEFIPSVPSAIENSGNVLGVSTMCVDIPRNLHRGAESSSVTILQKFLQSKGLLSEISGFYGDKTIEAVKDYQGSKGLVPTGMVYEVTRQAVRDETCK